MARFHSLLLGMYVMYEPVSPIHEEKMGRIKAEADQFVKMM